MGDRFLDNPILTPSSIKPSQAGLVVECVMNPGAFRFEGKTWLLLRVAERPEQKEGRVSFPIIGKSGELQILEFETNVSTLDLSDPRKVGYQGKTYLSTISHLRLVCSEDGESFYEPEDFPVHLFGQGPLETFGIEDCRVSLIDGVYYLTYTQVSENGVGVGLMHTRNWREMTRVGMIIPPHNKDCALFERTIDDRYFCLHRPSGLKLGGNFMWVASSPDLVHWGGHQCILQTREGWWDSARVGAGAAPIYTPEGWLEIYHGADFENRYCLGALLLDHDDPSKVLARSHDPIMEPEYEYEKNGFFGNVIFTNGHVVDGDTVTMYYGASDEYICGARFSIEEILDSVLKSRGSR